MGQFEIKGSKREELTPDVIIFGVYASIEDNNVIDNDDVINKAKDSLKKKVAKLSSDLEAISENCNVSFSNLTYSKNSVTDSFGASNQGFGLKKKQENHVNITANVYITIKLTTMDEDTLVDVLKLLLNSVEITSIHDTISVSDLEDKYNELKASVCKKCRSDADVIITNLGSSIIGVEKVVYNSGGSLLNDNRQTTVPKFSQSVSLDALDTNCYDFEEDAGYCDFGAEIANIKYDDIWARGFVKTILDRKFTIEDSVTVVFNIK